MSFPQNEPETETETQFPFPTHLIYKTPISLIIKNISTSNQIEINFTTLSIQRTTINIQSTLTGISAYGILGIFTFESHSYLIYITKSSYCCTVNNSPIYKIDSINIINLSSEQQIDCNNIILPNIQRLLENNFYYSPMGYDLTLTYTLQYQHSNYNYWYNIEWSKPFYTSNIGIKNEFILSIIHGYVGEFSYEIECMNIRVVFVIRRTIKEIYSYFCEIELFIYVTPCNEVFNYVMYSCIDKGDLNLIYDIINDTFIKCNNSLLNKVFIIENNNNNNNNKLNDKFHAKINSIPKVNCLYQTTPNFDEFLSNTKTKNTIINQIHYTQVQHSCNTFISPEYQLGHLLLITSGTSKTLLIHVKNIINYIVSVYFNKLNNDKALSTFKTNFSSLINSIIQSNTFQCISYYRLMKLFHKHITTKNLNEPSITNNDNIKTSNSDTLSIYAVTWNVQGLQIDNFIDIDVNQLIYPQQFDTIINKDKSPDIIIIGLQEIIELKAKSLIFQRTKTRKDRKDTWKLHFESALYGKYELVSSLDLVGMFLFCFVTKDKAVNIENVQSQKIKTGFKGVLGNKGYCIISIHYNGHNFAFVNGHFMSGESNEKNEGRLKEIHDLLQNEHNKDMLPVVDHHYYFLIGDFNFRVELTPEECNELIRKKDIDKIIQSEQFSQSKTKFPFKEGEISFLPTYKLGTSINEYNLKKTPSYCDRIFYKGIKEDTIKQVIYSSINYYCNSDHLPVCSLFHIDLNNDK